MPQPMPPECTEAQCWFRRRGSDEPHAHMTVYDKGTAYDQLWLFGRTWKLVRLPDTPFVPTWWEYA